MAGGLRAASGRPRPFWDRLRAMLVVSVIAGVISFLALLIYAGFLATRYFSVDRLPDEIHFATTPDGWRIALYRYRPGDRPGDHPGNGAGRPVAADPVLLIPGIGANRYNFDLNDQSSLARTLQARGYDTWVVEPRG